MSWDVQNFMMLEIDGDVGTVMGAIGEIIRDFSFSDRVPWPVAADGDGFSLALINPTSNPTHGDASNWRAGGFVGGSPASSDATKFSGDPTADENHNGLSDLIEYAIGDTLAPDFSSSGFITFRQNLLADDVLVSVETSDDLVTWHDGAEAVVPSGENHHGEGTATVVWQATDASAPCQFMRVRITLR